MPLHDMYSCQKEVADLERSFQWTGLKNSTEAIIMAAQEQAVSTSLIEGGVYHTTQDPKCRLCKDAPETVQLVTVGCEIQAGTAYRERYNQVAGTVFRGTEVVGALGAVTPR